MVGINNHLSMELQRFLTVINDILAEEKHSNITQLLRDIVKNIEELRAKRDPAKGKLVEESLDKLATILQRGALGTRIEHLGTIKRIKAGRFYGPEAFNVINGIFTKHTFNIASITTDLEAYIKEREAFLAQLTAARQSMSTFGFVPQAADEEVYEIGVTLPQAMTHNDVNEISEHLRKWNIIFATFQEVAGEDIANARVSGVSDDELTFFFIQSRAVSHCLEIVTRNIATIQEKIERVHALRGDLKKYLPRIDEAPLEEQERGIAAAQTEATVGYIMEKYGKGVKESRRTDLVSAVASIVTYLADLFNEGMEVVVRSPQGGTDVAPAKRTVNGQRLYAVADEQHSEELNDMLARMPTTSQTETAAVNESRVEKPPARHTDEDVVDTTDVEPEEDDNETAEDDGEVTDDVFMDEKSNGIFKKYFSGSKK